LDLGAVIFGGGSGAERLEGGISALLELQLKDCVLVVAILQLRI
jgi:hypothetical protein